MSAPEAQAGPMNKVTLSCPTCKRTRKTPGHTSDPAGTVRIVMQCPKCNPDGFEDVSYFDVIGKQLLVP